MAIDVIKHYKELLKQNNLSDKFFFRNNIFVCKNCLEEIHVDSNNAMLDVILMEHAKTQRICKFTVSMIQLKKAFADIAALAKLSAGVPDADYLAGHIKFCIDRLKDGKLYFENQHDLHVSLDLKALELATGIKEILFEDKK